MRYLAPRLVLPGRVAEIGSRRGAVGAPDVHAWANNRLLADGAAALSAGWGLAGGIGRALQLTVQLTMGVYYGSGSVLMPSGT